MATEKKEIKLTDDPLTNIYIMMPMLNDRAREAVSYLMYGYCLGKKLSNKDGNFSKKKN